MSCYHLEPKNKSDTLLRRHLPHGFAWCAFRIPGKNAYKFVVGLSKRLEAMWVAICVLVREEDPCTTEQLIDEWETSVGLPDGCMPIPTEIEPRRAAVKLRLSRKRYSIIDTWREIALQLGLDVTITPGTFYDYQSHYDFFYPMPYGGRRGGGMYRIYITLNDCVDGGYDYGYDFVYEFEKPECSQFRCMIERIRPANVIIIWGEDPPDIYDKYPANQSYFESSEFSKEFE